MMDLSEIRKKARTAPKKSAPSKKGEAPEVVAPAAVQEKTTEVKDVPSADVTSVVASKRKIDPIEALFASCSGSEVGEESEVDNIQSSPSLENMDSDIRQWLCFSLEEEEYAIDIENIREIIKPRAITDIPRAPDFMLGIISLRGIIIPIFDLKRRLRMGACLQQDNDSRIIVCQHEDRVVGLLVDRISQVVRIPAKCIEPPPAVLSGVDRDMVEGVGRSHDRMMIQLCLSSVLNAEYT